MKTSINNCAKVIFIGTLIVASAISVPAAAVEEHFERNQDGRFAILPDGSTGPEGLTVGPDGNIYASSGGFDQNGPVPGPGELFVLNPEGKLVRRVSIAGSTHFLAGLAFHSMTGALLVVDIGAAKVLNVGPVTGASAVFMSVTGNNPGLTNLTFDRAGNVYVSDAFQGIIWKTGPEGGVGAVWVNDVLLRTAAFQRFGADGIGFNRAQDILFVANTGDNNVIQIPVTNGVPGKPAVFVHSISGADGLIVDSHDNLWVASDQNDQIIVVSPNGKLLARLGRFEGVDADGLPHGLLFPSSAAFSLDGQFLYVANFALDVRNNGPGIVQAVDSQWCAMVKHFTVSRLRSNFRPLIGDQNRQ